MPTKHRRVNLSVPPTVEAVLSDLATRTGRSMSALVMEAVAAHLPTLQRRLRDCARADQTPEGNSKATSVVQTPKPEGKLQPRSILSTKQPAQRRPVGPADFGPRPQPQAVKLSPAERLQARAQVRRIAEGKTPAP